MGLISFPLFLTTGHDQRATGLGMIATRTQISVVCQLQGSTIETIYAKIVQQYCTKDSAKGSAPNWRIWTKMAMVWA